MAGLRGALFLTGAGESSATEAGALEVETGFLEVVDITWNEKEDLRM